MAEEFKCPNCNVEFTITTLRDEEIQALTKALTEAKGALELYIEADICSSKYCNDTGTASVPDCGDWVEVECAFCHNNKNSLYNARKKAKQFLKRLEE